MRADQRERYLRHVLLKEIGGQGQQRLLAARVLVVGAGGLGAPLIQYLAAAGVGALGVADDDVVALSNLQRQTIFRVADIGARKADAAAAFVANLNPDVRFEAIAARIDASNADEIFAAYDLVVEGVDSIDGRYTLNAAAIRARKPLVSAAVGRFEGHLAVFKPYAAAGLPCYRCLAPEAPPRDAVVNCAEEGVAGPVVGVVGALAAMEVLKELLGIGESLAGRLLIYDALGARTRTVRLPADPQCKDCSAIRRGPVIP